MSPRNAPVHMSYFKACDALNFIGSGRGMSSLACLSAVKPRTAALDGGSLTCLYEPQLMSCLPCCTPRLWERIEDQFDRSGRCPWLLSLKQPCFNITCKHLLHVLPLLRLRCQATNFCGFRVSKIVRTQTLSTQHNVSFADFEARCSHCEISKDNL